MPRATLVYTSEYLLEAHHRYHQQGAAKFFFLAAKVLGIAFFIPQAVWNFEQGRQTNAMISIGMILLFWFLHSIVSWFAQWSFQKRPYYGQTLVVEFSDEGFYGRAETMEIRLPWPAFRKVVHFRDGFLIFQGPKSFNWIPVTALENPSQTAELEALLRTKIPRHKIIAPCVSATPLK